MRENKTSSEQFAGETKALTLVADEGRYRALIEQNSDAISLLAPNGRLLYASPSISRVLGYHPEEVVGRNALELLHEEDRPPVRERLADLVRRPGEAVRAEVRIRRRQGTWGWIECTGVNLLHDPSVLAIVVNLRDITERKKAQQELHRRSVEFEVLYRLTEVLNRATALEQIYDEALTSIRRAVGAQRSAVLFFDPDGVPRFKAWHGLSDGYRRAVEGHTPWPQDARNPEPVAVDDILRVSEDSGLAPFRSTILEEGIRSLLFVPICASGRLLGKFMVYRDLPEAFTAHDIRLTQTIAAHIGVACEKRWRESLLRLLQAAAMAANEAVTIESAIRVCLREVCQCTGWPVGHALLPAPEDPSELVSSDLWYVHEGACLDTFQAASANLRFPAGVGLPGLVLAKGKSWWLRDVREHPGFLRGAAARELGLQGGFCFPVLVAGEVAGVLEFFSPQPGSDSDILGHVATSIGVQLGRVIERSRSERALRESEERYRAVAETASDAIISIDESSRIQFANRTAEKVFGYPVSELMDQDVTMLIPEWLRPAHRRGLHRYFETGERHVSWEAFEVPGLHKSGREIPLEISFGEYRKAGRHVFTAVIRDITERKRLEEQLRHTQKLESLGVLAGGVAHDFNNLLTGIMGNASVALEALSPGNPAAGPLEDVISASQRAADLTQQLLAYAGKGRFVIQPVNLSSLVREISSLIQSSIPKTVRLQFELAENLPPVEGDASQLQQLIMNLIINGAEAIGEEQNGTVLVVTGAVTLDRDYIVSALGSPELAPGAYVLLEVQDSGRGMDEDTIGRIFDPFFTTKFTGRGLGLAAASGIVRGHKGAIKVYSVPGRGTTFKVFFRALPGTLQPGPAAREEQSLTGQGTLLVVDDEEIVRRTAKAGLERYGYTVLLAEDGPQAVSFFRDRAAEIDLVLLDMTMPGMGGEETLRHLRAIRPDIRVVLSSGYNELEATRRFSGKRLAGFIQKPYTAAKLAEKIRSALALEA